MHTLLYLVESVYGLVATGFRFKKEAGSDEREREIEKAGGFPVFFFFLFFFLFFLFVLARRAFCFSFPLLFFSFDSLVQRSL